MTVTLRASNFGSCVRAQVAAHLGMKALPTSERMQGLYDRGNQHEDTCVHKMGVDGWMFEDNLPQDEGQNYIELTGDGWMITGHLDGIAAPEQDGPLRMVEIKSPSTWQSFERAVRTNDFSTPYMNTIAWQVSVYMVATGLEAVMACWTEEHGVRTFGIETPIYTGAEIIERAQDIRDLVAERVAPSVCSQNDWPCPFAYLHDTPEVVEDADLDRDASLYAHWADAEKKAKAQKDEYRDKLLAHGGAETARWKVTVSEATSSRYDYAAIAAAGIDLTPYRTETVSTRVKVTPRTRTDVPD